MARWGTVGACVLAWMCGCIAPAATIGALDEAGSVSTEPSGSATAVVSSTSSSTTQVSDSSGDVDCDPPCTAFFDCQDAQCSDGECVVSFRHDRCESGALCGPSGCEPTPLACDDPAVLVCEGFEADGFAAQWGSGSVPRVADPVNTGTGAGWVKVGPDGREQLKLTVDPPLDEGLLAIRAFVWLPAADTVEQWVILFEIFGSTNAGTERVSVDLRPQAGLMFVSLLSPEATVVGNDLLTPGAWSCVELRVQLSQGQGEVELRVDDVPVLSNGPGLDTVPVDGVAHIQIGGLGSPNHSGDTAFGIDDIVVATAPIGCDVGP